MYYSELVKKACVIMYDAHKEDKDKGGYPYVFHPFYLATQMDDEDSTCSALLHDVVEDHGSRYSFAYDTERSAVLQNYNLTVIRVSNADVDQNFSGVCAFIDRRIKEELSKWED